MSSPFWLPAVEAAGQTENRVERKVRLPSSPDFSVSSASYWLPAPQTVVLGCDAKGVDSQVEIFYTHRATGASLPALRNVSGTLRFAVVRPFALDRGPVRPGQVLRAPRRRVTIRDIEHRGAASMMTVVVESVEAPLLGRTLLLPHWFVFDPADKGCYRPLGFHLGGVMGTGLPYQRSQERWQGWTGGPHSPPPSSDASRPRPQFPKQWLLSTELVFLSAERLGTLEVPFELAEIPASR